VSGNEPLQIVIVVFGRGAQPHKLIVRDYCLEGPVHVQPHAHAEFDEDRLHFSGRHIPNSELAQVGPLKIIPGDV